jgi:hypothetical protein
MRFRLSKEAKGYFSYIMAEGGYSGDKGKFLQFDIYYYCALIGFSALRINEETSDLDDGFMQTYPKEYKNSKAYIAGLLVSSEFKRQRIDVTGGELEQLMLKYLDNENDTHLSNEGFAKLDAYALAGLQIYKEKSVDSPRSKEDFLLTVKQIIESYKP